MSYWLKCRRNTESKIPKVVKTKNGRMKLLSKLTVCDGKKSEFVKEQESRGLFNKLTGIKIPILNGLLIANILF